MAGKCVFQPEEAGLGRSPCFRPVAVLAVYGNSAVYDGIGEYKLVTCQHIKGTSFEGCAFRRLEFANYIMIHRFGICISIV